MKTNNDVFANVILNEEEKAMEEAFGRDEYMESDDLEATRVMLIDAAKNHRVLNVSKPITIRVNQLDLIKVKARAKRENMPYQTLLSTLIHQYAEKKVSVRL